MKKDFSYEFEIIGDYFDKYTLSELSLGYIRSVISENYYYSRVPRTLDDIAHGQCEHSRAVKFYNELYKFLVKTGRINPKKVKNVVTKDVLVNYCKGGDDKSETSDFHYRVRNKHAHWNF